MSVLWSEGNDLGDGYRSFRTVTNIHLHLDACKGVKEYGGVHDGTEIILWEWNDGDNQKWIIFPYCKSFAQTLLNNILPYLSIYLFICLPNFT